LSFAPFQLIYALFLRGLHYSHFRFAVGTNSHTALVALHLKSKSISCALFEGMARSIG
jgi:hypothetical protein